MTGAAEALFTAEVDEEFRGVSSALQPGPQPTPLPDSARAAMSDTSAARKAQLLFG